MDDEQPCSTVRCTTTCVRSFVMRNGMFTLGLGLLVFVLLPLMLGLDMLVEESESSSWGSEENSRLRPLCPEHLTSLDEQHKEHELHLVDPPTFKVNQGDHVTGDEPLSVIQIGLRPQIPEALRRIMERNSKILGRRVHFHHVQVHEMRTLIRKDGNATVLDAFDSIRSPTLKAAVYAFFHLYHHGGAAMHWDVEVTGPIDALVRSALMNHQLVASPSGSFLAARRNSPVVKAIRDYAADFIVRRLYGSSVHAATSEGLFLNAVSTLAHRRVPDGSIFFLAHEKRPECALGRLYADGIAYLLTGRAHTAAHLYMEMPHFVQLWMSRDLYTSDLGQVIAEDELQRRETCPHGKTDVIVSHPTGTPEEERVLIPVHPLVPARIAVKIRFKIPLVVIQMGKSASVPLEMQAAIMGVKRKNKHMSFRYFDVDSARRFIAKYADANFTEAYDTLIPAQMKADFFCYVFLYVHGGVCLGTMVTDVAQLSISLQLADQFVASAQESQGGTANTINTQFIAAAPGHPVIARTIQTVVSNVQRRALCADLDSTTGAGPLSQAFVSLVGQVMAEQDYRNGIRLGRFKKEKGCAIGTVQLRGTTVLTTHYPLFGKEQAWYDPVDAVLEQCREQKILAPIPRSVVEDAHGAPIHSPEEYKVTYDVLRARRLCQGGKTKEEWRALAASQEFAMRIAAFNATRDEELRASGWGTVGSIGATQSATLRIPKQVIFFGIGPLLPPRLMKSVESFMTHNPDYAITYFDNDHAQILLEKRLGPKIRKYFQLLPSWDEKQAFFCLAFLVTEGGICVQLGMQAVGPFEFGKEDGLVISLDSLGRPTLSFIAAHRSHFVCVDAMKTILLSLRGSGIANISHFFVSSLARHVHKNQFVSDARIKVGSTQAYFARLEPMFDSCLESSLTIDKRVVMVDMYSQQLFDFAVLPIAWGRNASELFSANGWRWKRLRGIG